MTQPIKQHGYTLIELLLVIAIIASISTVAISMYRRYQINHRLTLAAVELQNFIEAAINYHNEQGKWPAAHAELTHCSSSAPAMDDFIQHYVPNQSAHSIIGHYYCWSPVANSTALFWVAIQTSRKNAIHIAAQLPNAIITDQPDTTNNTCNTTSTCYVRIEIPRTTTAINNGLIIAGIGNCEPNKTSVGSNPHIHCQYLGTVGAEPKPVNYQIQFNCPSSMQGNLMASVNYLDVGEPNGDPYVLRTLQLTTHCQQQQQTMTCQLQIHAARAMGYSVASGAHGHVGASYMAYCSPLTKPPTYYY